MAARYPRVPSLSRVRSIREAFLGKSRFIPAISRHLDVPSDPELALKNCPIVARFALSLIVSDDDVIAFVGAASVVALVARSPKNTAISIPRSCLALKSSILRHGAGALRFLGLCWQARRRRRRRGRKTRPPTNHTHPEGPSGDPPLELPLRALCYTIIAVIHRWRVGCPAS